MHKQITQIWGWFGRKGVLLFVLILSLLLLGFTIYRFRAQSIWMQDDFAKQIQSIELNNSFAQLSLYIKEAESANRGYAISGDKKFDENYVAAIDSIRTTYLQLQRLQNRKESELDATLFLKSDSLMQQKIAWMQRINTLCDNGNRSEALAIITIHKGLGLADSITRINNKISKSLQAQIQHSQIGYLNADNRNDHLAYFGIVASMLLIVAVFYFLIKEIRRTERVSEELRESKEHLKITLNSIGEGIITTNRLGGILYMNPPAERLTGWSNKEAKNQPLQKVYDVVNEETARPFEDIVSRILKDGKKIEFENNTILKAKNSQSFIISNNGSPLLDAKGNISGVVLVFNDITEKKKNEKELKESEKVIRDYQFALNVSSLVDISDSKGIIQFVNENFCSISKYGKVEIIGNEHRMFSSGFHTKAFIKNLWDTITSGKVWREEVKNKAKDGTYYWVDTTIVPFLGQDGKPFQFITIRNDITRRKEAEANMRKAIERYDILSQATSDTIWDWDITTNQIIYNDGITQMFGYEISEVDNVIDWWKMNIHPEDLQTVSESLEDAFKKEMQNLQLEYRFRSADKIFRYIYDRAFIIYDEYKKPVRMIGAMQDVTYAKEEEKRIAKAIMDAQEQERGFIGGELHDNVNQILAVSLLSLGMAKEKQMDMEEGSEYMEITKGYILNAIDEVRKLSHQLAPADFADNSLKDIFEELLSSINVDNRYNVSLHFGEINKKHISDDIQINLFRILQEQIKNILKYSEADTIEISVAQAVNAVRMRIFDNGKGFNTKATEKGIGLSNIKKRAESFSGKFILNSAPGNGCEIIVEIPLDNYE